MENQAVIVKDNMKVEIPEITSPKTGMATNSGYSRQGSSTKHSCLCSPTTHAGSFRCRLHRGPVLQRTKSIESRDSQS